MRWRCKRWRLCDYYVPRYANVYTSILERRSNPSSHSRGGDRLVRFRVTNQEAWVAAQRMRFRDVMFDVGYRAKTGVWGE